MAGVKEEQDLDSFLTKSFLNLEKIDDSIYRSNCLWHPVFSVSVYGGQLIGQALVAATKTVPSDVIAHSLHAYFLDRGNGKRPMIYHVDRTREGTTYCSRTVKATQSGKAVLTLQASFKKDEDDPYYHQYKMPEVPGPKDLLNTEDLLRIVLERTDLSEERRKTINYMLQEDLPMEIKPVYPEKMYTHKPQEPKRLLWIRAKGHIGEDINMHKCAAAYMSDLLLLGVAMLPAGRKELEEFRMTSLDHSMWFHNIFRANEWLLYEMESPHCGSGRAFTLGRLWRQDGILAVSLSQEGVLRTNFGKL